MDNEPLFSFNEIYSNLKFAMSDLICSAFHVSIEILISYMLGREYRVMRNWYSRLLFTSEDRLCANLCLQEQSTNMTSQC